MKQGLLTDRQKEVLRITSYNVCYTKLLRDGAKSDANFKVNFNCRIDVYPEPVPRAIGGKAKFICDVHLGTLSKYLRFLGFDTIYRNDYSDSEIVRVAVVEKRIILTKDRGILKRRIVEDGYLVRGIKPWEQLEEVLRITSYNVCYTKLLRPKTSASLMLLAAGELLKMVSGSTWPAIPLVLSAAPWYCRKVAGFRMSWR